MVAKPARMRALGFCVSVEHARYMAQEVHGGGAPAVMHRWQHARARAHRGSSFGSPPVNCVPSSPSTCLARGSMCPSSTRCCCCAPPERDHLHPAARARPAAGAGQAEPHSHRPHRSATPLVPLRPTSLRHPRRAAWAGPQAGRRGLPVPPERLPYRTRPREPRDRARQLEEPSQDSASGEPSSTISRASIQRDPRPVLGETDREPVDLYRSSDASWTRLRRAAGLPTASSPDARARNPLLRAVRRSLHVDDPERVRFYSADAGSAQPTPRRRNSTHASAHGRDAPMGAVGSEP